MSALIVVDLTPMDSEKLASYSALAAETLIPFGGEFIAKGNIESLHGAAIYQKKVVIQFPDHESALNWYRSDNYQKIIPSRDLGMKSQFHLIS